MPIPNLTSPVNGTTPVVSNVPSIRFEWANNGKAGIRRWWLFVGTKIGPSQGGFNQGGVTWNIWNTDMGPQSEAVIPHNQFVDSDGKRLDPGIRVCTQVMYEIVNDPAVGPERGITEVTEFEMP